MSRGKVGAKSRQSRGKDGAAWLFFGLVLILSLPFFYVLGATGAALPFVPALPISAVMVCVPMSAALLLVGRQGGFAAQRWLEFQTGPQSKGTRCGRDPNARHRRRITHTAGPVRPAISEVSALPGPALLVPKVTFLLCTPRDISNRLQHHRIFCQCFRDDPEVLPQHQMTARCGLQQRAQNGQQRTFFRPGRAQQGRQRAMLVL